MARTRRVFQIPQTLDMPYACCAGSIALSAGFLILQCLPLSIPLACPSSSVSYWLCCLVLKLSLGTALSLNGPSCLQAQKKAKLNSMLGGSKPSGPPPSGNKGWCLGSCGQCNMQMHVLHFALAYHICHIVHNISYR